MKLEHQQLVELLAKLRNSLNNSHNSTLRLMAGPYA